MASLSSADRFRAIFSHFPTGVAVVTGIGEQGAVGMTSNAVCSLSLDPLLLLVCFDNEARTLPVVQKQGRFGVNILRADQGELSRVFASKRDEKFEDVPFYIRADVPIIKDALAWIICDLKKIYPGGDHTIGIGAVIEMSEPPDGDPL